MFWIIETEEAMEYLTHKTIAEAFVEIVPLHDNIHPALNDVSLVYIRPFNDTKGYMLCVDHSETFSLYKTAIDALLQKIGKVWVRDKKTALYYFPIKSLCDLSILNPTYIQTETQAHNYFYSHHTDYPKVNKLVPLSKHYEKCEHIYKQVRSVIPKELPPYFDFYNNKVVLAFFGIEKNGLKIDKYEFDKHYELNNEFYSIQGDRIYTSYNLATTTRRPSNSFNGVNFAAINKENGARRSYISSHGYVEFDISAYHPTIVGRLLAYDFGDVDVHQAFADLYQTSYKEAKEITFKQLYGGVFKEYEHLEFFQQVKKFINQKWAEYTDSGEVVVPGSGYVFKASELENMNPQKLFNYMLQNVETSTNVCILMEIHKLLRGKNTKLVLYTYDSFLLDYDESENLLDDIENIFKNKKLQIKVKHGSSYDFE